MMHAHWIARWLLEQRRLGRQIAFGELSHRTNPYLHFIMLEAFFGIALPGIQIQAVQGQLLYHLGGFGMERSMHNFAVLQRLL